MIVRHASRSVLDRLTVSLMNRILGSHWVLISALQWVCNSKPIQEKLICVWNAGSRFFAKRNERLINDRSHGVIMAVYWLFSRLTIAQPPCVVTAHFYGFICIVSPVVHLAFIVVANRKACEAYARPRACSYHGNHERKYLTWNNRYPGAAMGISAPKHKSHAWLGSLCRIVCFLCCQSHSFFDRGVSCSAVVFALFSNMYVSILDTGGRITGLAVYTWPCYRLIHLALRHYGFMHDQFGVLRFSDKLSSVAFESMPKRQAAFQVYCICFKF